MVRYIYERSFSAMTEEIKVISTADPHMGQQRLNDVMLLHIHKKRTDDEIDLQTAVQAFVSVNDERIRYFGNGSAKSA